MSNSHLFNGPKQAMGVLATRLRLALKKWHAARQSAWEAERLSNHAREDAGLLPITPVDGVLSGRRPYPSVGAQFASNDSRSVRRAC